MCPSRSACARVMCTHILVLCGCTPSALTHNNHCPTTTSTHVDPNVYALSLTPKHSHLVTSFPPRGTFVGGKTDICSESSPLSGSSGSPTHVLTAHAHAAPEETPASFAGENAEVISTGVVATNPAQSTEGRISWRRWQSNKYSVGVSTKFVSPCINIPQCRHFCCVRPFGRCNAAVCPAWHNVLSSIFCTIFLIGLRKGVSSRINLM